jgi:hypothetical protein
MAILSLHHAKAKLMREGENQIQTLNSTTTTNLKRTSMYDGSFDDF